MTTELSSTVEKHSEIVIRVIAESKVSCDVQCFVFQKYVTSQDIIERGVEMQ